jgi:hypothetical protein
LTAVSDKPKHHHLDKRAADLIAAGAGDPDDMLTTKELAAWFGVSTQWLEIGRSRGYGPLFVRLSPRMTRYKRSAALAWLAEREHASTAAYRTPNSKEPLKGALMEAWATHCESGSNPHP